MPSPRRLGTRPAVALALSFLTGAPMGPANAADLPSRAPPVELPRPPAFTWTGFYVGVNAGYGFTGGGSTFNDATYGTVILSGGRDGGFLGGVQAGYNYQFRPGSGLVLGVETDFQGTAFGKAATGTIGSVAYYGVAPSLDWFGTVRGRVGYAFDRVLVYGTGGFAYGGGSASPYAASYPYTLPDTTRLGYAVGAGVEYAFTERLSAKLEGLYVNLGRRGAGATVYDTATSAYYGTGRGDDGFGIVRAGLNYRF